MSYDYDPEICDDYAWAKDGRQCSRCGHTKAFGGDCMCDDRTTDHSTAGQVSDEGLEPAEETRAAEQIEDVRTFLLGILVADPPKGAQVRRTKVSILRLATALAMYPGKSCSRPDIRSLLWSVGADDVLMANIRAPSTFHDHFYDLISATWTSLTEKTSHDAARGMPATRELSEHFLYVSLDGMEQRIIKLTSYDAKLKDRAVSAYRQVFETLRAHLER